ncbi:hypothetical protein ISN45_At03g040400 [Arabidopsis thaliana x Arabidopsis arenosa]|uniref:Uncharacterized protein n=1 Tax=Arabidopsis thaliana x Arabidopsis arenosa TaxID=1240361 RepID=A0A8T2EZA6_9BRAS|nr:hypothetical protein ISN45_At03g040400 [Arabidopsis thaliana x Arabidopsis arenosa]
MRSCVFSFLLAPEILKFVVKIDLLYFLLPISSKNVILLGSVFC